MKKELSIVEIKNNCLITSEGSIIEAPFEIPDSLDLEEINKLWKRWSDAIKRELEDE